MKQEIPSTPGFRIFMFAMLLLLTLCSYFWAAPFSSSCGAWLLDCAVSGLTWWNKAGFWRLLAGASLFLFMGQLWIRTNNVFVMLGMLVLACFCSFPAAVCLAYANSPLLQEGAYFLPPLF